jgi:GTP cyclohydrolase I
VRDDQFYKLPDSTIKLVPFGPLEDQSVVAEALLSALPAWERTPEAHRARTPERFVEMLRQMTTREEFKFTTFPAKHDEMVIVEPISFYTLCAHHLAPFFGFAYVAYIPDELVAGLSKLPRAVKYVAKGFHVQEELTGEIADFLEEKLHPKGLGVILKAEHLCMAMRGVEERNVKTTTSAMRGVFLDTTKGARNEFLQLIGGQK